MIDGIYLRNKTIRRWLMMDRLTVKQLKYCALSIHFFGFLMFVGIIVAVNMIGLWCWFLTVPIIPIFLISEFFYAEVVYTEKIISERYYVINDIIDGFKKMRKKF